MEITDILNSGALRHRMPALGCGRRMGQGVSAVGQVHTSCSGWVRVGGAGGTVAA